LLQGLELTRASIVELSTDESCEKSQCWIGPTTFQVLRPSSGVPEDLAPENYSLFEEKRLLETIARYKSVTIISLCDQGNNGWIKNLGLPLLCLENNWSAREIAWHLLELWRNQPKNASNTSLSYRSANGLSWLVRKVDELYVDQNKESFASDHISDHSHEPHFDHEVPRNFRETQNTDFQGFFLRSACLFLAWSCLFIGIMSIMTKESYAMQRFRIRRLHHRNANDLSCTSIMDELIIRIPEVDKAWNVLLDFVEETWSRWGHDENFDYSFTGSSNGFPMHTNPTRRKRATKKRH
jgi:hypothetical protein